MSESKMIERFEKYYDLKWSDCNRFMQESWRAAWYASRHELLIELPREVTHVTSPQFEEGRDAVIQAIEAQGLRVKQ